MNNQLFSLVNSVPEISRLTLSFLTNNNQDYFNQSNIVSVMNISSTLLQDTSCEHFFLLSSLLVLDNVQTTNKHCFMHVLQNSQLTLNNSVIDQVNLQQSLIDVATSTVTLANTVIKNVGNKIAMQPYNLISAQTTTLVISNITYQDSSVSFLHSVLSINFTLENSTFKNIHRQSSLYFQIISLKNSVLSMTKFTANNIGTELFKLSDCNITLVSSTISNIQGHQSGGIYMNGGVALIQKTNFTSLTQAQKGGCVQMFHNQEIITLQKLTIADSIFMNNHVWVQGAGLCV